MQTSILLAHSAEGTGIDRDALRTVIGLVDTNQAVCQFKHIVSERNNDKLSILRAFLDIICDDRNVFEVKRGINLVHNVQRGRFVVMQCKNEG